MTATSDLLIDAFDRIAQSVRRTLKDIGEQTLRGRVDPDANSIAWLVWHLTRIQDYHIADVAGREQAWTDAGWRDRFGLPFGDADTGYGHSSADVAALGRATAENLLGYHDEVHRRTAEYLVGVTDDDLARVVDTAWDPPVTLAVRLVSVIADDLQHAGQAAFVRGVLERG